ncbi:MAG: pyridoxal-phosphate dependent enzyme [Bacteroidota bacterium]
MHRTPLLTSEILDDLSGARLHFKCENFQKAGAFKARGAFHVMSLLTAKQRSRGVITHSSGNHGQALAKAAGIAGVDATIVMPSNSPLVKIAAVKHYGANIILCKPTQEAREETCEREMARTGAHLIPPYDDYRIISGQATCALEVIEDQPDMEVLIAPVGGGGLLAGSGLAAHWFSDSMQVIGAEPVLADDTARSFRSGIYSPRYSRETVADGVRVGVGKLTFPIIQQCCTDVLTATEDQIVHAMQLIWERLKIIVETSCALPLAVVLANPDRFKDKRIALILTGGNVDLTLLPFTMT